MRRKFVRGFEIRDAIFLYLSIIFLIGKKKVGKKHLLVPYIDT